MKTIIFLSLMSILAFSAPIAGISPQKAKSFEINTELKPEEVAWWKRVEGASHNIGEAVTEIGIFLYEDKNEEFRFLDFERKLQKLPKGLREKYFSARAEFREVITEGIQKGYRTSIENARPRVFWMPKPAYTKEAFQNKICGVAVYSVTIEETGAVGSIEFQKSFERPCPLEAERNSAIKSSPPVHYPPPPLGVGLEESGANTIKHGLFFPAIKDHRLVPATARIEISFIQYT